MDKKYAILVKKHECKGANRSLEVSICAGIFCLNVERTFKEVRQVMKKKYIDFNNRIMKYFRWPMVYLVAMLVMVSMVILVNQTEGLIMLGVWVCLAGLSYGIYQSTKKHLLKEMVNFSIDYVEKQKKFLNQMDLANVILDATGMIRWHNQSFQEMVLDLGEEDAWVNQYIQAILPEVNQEIFPSGIEDKTEKNLTIGRRHYKVVIKYMRVVWDEKAITMVQEKELDQQLLYNLLFFDVTEETNLKLKIKEQKAVTALIYIDNYEEVIDSNEDARKPIITALMERALGKFAKEIDGVLKKYEKDKYVLIFQKKYLIELENNRFNILDTIKEINIGNGLPITISMGIGLNDFSYIQSIKHAKEAIDLALGRGGDQVVIKKGSKLSFYGGKTKSVETTTRVKARIKAYAFRELIGASDRVIVMGHKRQDLDSLGAAVGIYSSVKQLGKKVHIVMDEVTSAIEPLYVRLEENQGDLEDLFVTGEEATNLLTEETLLVVVDVNRPSYTEYAPLLEEAEKVVVFDHHRVTSEPVLNPVLSYIEPYASSTCEMVTEILMYILDKVKLEPVEADALLAGITVDTKNFVVKTGVKTFEAAAFLRRNGAGINRVRNLLKSDMAAYKARAITVKDCEIYKEKIAISISPTDIENPTLIAAQAADELLNIAGIQASFVLSNIDEVIYISARSLEDMNVQLIMEVFGGGGHLSVAGAQISDLTEAQVIEQLKKVIDQHI